MRPYQLSIGAGLALALGRPPGAPFFVSAESGIRLGCPVCGTGVPPVPEIAKMTMPGTAEATALPFFAFSVLVQFDVEAAGRRHLAS